MLPDSRFEEKFFARLTSFDAEIARNVAEAGCRYCDGPLYQANYARKPRGGLIAEAGEAFSLRHSLCCGRSGCRRRALPPSLRFLGRKVYIEVVVLLASLAAQVAAAFRDARSATGVPVRTLHRWGEWWRGTFAQGSTWLELQARFRPPPPDPAGLPHSLVERLSFDLKQQQLAATVPDVCALAARLLAPSTTLSVLDGSRFVRALRLDSRLD